MIEYNEIIHIGSDRELICRDGNKQWADSMDLMFRTYDQFEDVVKYSLRYKAKRAFIVDVAIGWTRIEELDKIIEVIEYYRNFNCFKFFIKLVDQFEYQWSSPVYDELTKFCKRTNTRIIKTYMCDYNGLDSIATIPYPYLEEDELPIVGDEERETNFILTGADIKDIYPTRCRLYELADGNIIKTLKHPGYSGNHWNEGKVGFSYLKELNRHWFMICTTTYPDEYDLLKYVECAEAGCICVGEVPKMLKGTEAEKHIIKIPENKLTDSQLLFKFLRELSEERVGMSRYALDYRDAIKKLRDKERIKRYLLDSINMNW